MTTDHHSQLLQLSLDVLLVLLLPQSADRLPVVLDLRPTLLLPGRCLGRLRLPVAPNGQFGLQLQTAFLEALRVGSGGLVEWIGSAHLAITLLTG